MQNRNLLTFIRKRSGAEPENFRVCREFRCAMETELETLAMSMVRDLMRHKRKLYMFDHGRDLSPKQLRTLKQNSIKTFLDMLGKQQTKLRLIANKKYPFQ